MTDLPDYRHILRQEFEGRAARRQRYSLRAFARLIGVSPAHLSEVLNRRKSLSEAAAHRIAGALGWDAVQASYFADLVRYEMASTDEVKGRLARQLQAARQVSPFTAIAGEGLSDSFRWFHMAITDLFGLKAFKPSVRWIAAKLRITVVETEAALEWLRSQKVVEGRGEDLKRCVESYVVVKPKPEVARQLYRASLDTAKVALLQQAELAEFGVVTMSFDPKRWPEAIARIRAFQADMARLARPGEDEAVYQLGIQFLRLDDPDVG